MSRLKRYVQSLASGYLMLGANILYTLGSVPLVLRYLSQAEFGLWALVTQLGFYLNLVDFGMSGAGTRILIDHKDDRESPNYGSVILTSVLVNAVQAGLILAIGGLVAVRVGPWLGVPEAMIPTFQTLVFWQCAGLAVTSALRTASTILMAHQRTDLVNLSQTVLFLLNFGVLWFGLHRGWGILSLVWAQVLGQVLGSGITVAWCFRLALLPQPGRWGRPRMTWFGELFSYGRDMFLYSVGNLLINFSQTLLISRVAGLDTAAVWSVCTRAFNLASQFIYRIFDASVPALGEMIVRREQERLRHRFRSMVIASGSVALLAGVALGTCNQSFVHWWTGGKIGWKPIHDWLLGAWLVILVLIRSHTGLVGLTKEFRFLRYIYFCEGVFFVIAGFAALHAQGLAAMLLVSILGSLGITLPYSLWRTARYFGLPWHEVALGWARPTITTLPALVGISLAAHGLAGSHAPLTRMIIGCGVVLGLGGLAVLRWGLDEPMRRELFERLRSVLPSTSRGLGTPPR